MVTSHRGWSYALGVFLYVAPPPAPSRTIPWFDRSGPIWNDVTTRLSALNPAPLPSGVHDCLTVVCTIDSTRPQGKVLQSASPAMPFCATACVAAVAPATPTHARTQTRATERRVIASLRQRVEIEHRVQQRSRAPQGTKPALEDRVDVAGAVQVYQRAVHRKLEVGIVAAHDQAIRLVGEITGNERQRSRIR